MARASTSQDKYVCCKSKLIEYCQRSTLSTVLAKKADRANAYSTTEHYLSVLAPSYKYHILNFGYSLYSTREQYRSVLAPYKWKILAWPNWCGHRLDERGQ